MEQNNAPTWRTNKEVTQPGTYLCVHELDLIGNGFLIFVEPSERGLIFNKAGGRVELAQVLDCTACTEFLFFGPIPNKPK